MAVGNFTPDPLTWYHQGLSGTIKPGEVVTDRDRGWENHVLNKLGPRGLVRLEYGDDPEVAKKASMEAFNRFWTKQVMDFNELNEQRKNEGKMYVPPTKELQEHADLLGYELVGPWKLQRRIAEKEDADKTQTARGKSAAAGDAKVTELETRISGIEGRLNEVIDLLNSAFSSDAQTSGASDDDAPDADDKAKSGGSSSGGSSSGGSSSGGSSSGGSSSGGSAKKK